MWKCHFLFPQSLLASDGHHNSQETCCSLPHSILLTLIHSSASFKKVKHRVTNQYCRSCERSWFHMNSDYRERKWIPGQASQFLLQATLTEQQLSQKPIPESLRFLVRSPSSFRCGTFVSDPSWTILRFVGMCPGFKVWVCLFQHLCHYWVWF